MGKYSRLKKKYTALSTTVDNLSEKLSTCVVELQGSVHALQLEVGIRDGSTPDSLRAATQNTAALQLTMEGLLDEALDRVASLSLDIHKIKEKEAARALAYIDAIPVTEPEASC